MNAPTQPYTVNIQSLSKKFQHQLVLNDVCLQVEQGRILGLIGRNGAGKSTLLRCILGLLKPDQGQAEMLGCPSLHLSNAEKVALSYVPQQPDSFEWMTLGAMLDFVGTLYPHWDAALVQELLDRWQMNTHACLNVLSPGKRQQAALIRALASRPRLMILDEPASALDPLARRAFLSEIVDCAASQNTTVILSSHIISDLERVASDIAFLHQGRLILHTPLDELKERMHRVWLPSSANLPSQPLVGERTRRRLSDGSWSLLVDKGSEAEQQSGAQIAALNLEDVFEELAQ